MSFKITQDDELNEDDDDTEILKIPSINISNKPNAKKSTTTDASDDDSESGSDDSESDDDSINDTNDDDDDDSQADPEEDALSNPISSQETGKAAGSAVLNLSHDDDDDDEDDDDDDDHYLQKLDENLKTNIIAEFHPEMKALNYDEVDILSRVVRNNDGLIIDPLHRTLPFITKYERARVLGERAKQLNSGAKPFVEIDPSIIDGYLIALAEFEQKKIPFIIKRPLPNGGCEYWKMRDLEVL